ncbi:MAG TPA: carboxypeptidase-like regulatory domain-containing protein [Candidatus Saccharimonadales bacterium]|nr:carboxypeptidase-like regulatory domain-containing protein [Candidatus Saccharimonadales bacterium]
MHLCRYLMAMILAFAPSMVVVSGKLIDREGKPMQKAAVVYTSTATGRTFKTQTGKKGEFSFAGVPPGQYEITVTDANGQQVYSGKKYLYLVNENQIADPTATNSLMIDLSTVGQGELTKVELQRVRRENANVSEINRLILDLHTALDGHEWPRATQALTRLIALAPGRWEFYQNLGTVQTNLAADAASYPALPLFNLCATYYNLSRMTEAVVACNRVIASDPKMEDAYYIKAAALLGSGRLQQGKLVAPPETREAINKYLELAPQGHHAADARSLLEKLDSEVETSYKPKTGVVKKK